MVRSFCLFAILLGGLNAFATNVDCVFNEATKKYVPPSAEKIKDDLSDGCRSQIANGDPSPFDFILVPIRTASKILGPSPERLFMGVQIYSVGECKTSWNFISVVAPVEYACMVSHKTFIF